MVAGVGSASSGFQFEKICRIIPIYTDLSIHQIIGTRGSLFLARFRAKHAAWKRDLQYP